MRDVRVDRILAAQEGHAPAGLVDLRDERLGLLVAASITDDDGESILRQALSGRGSNAP